jgi:hypothetical protein
MTTTMRAKFQVTKVERFATCENVQFAAVSKPAGYPEDGSDEDNTYAKFSPSAKCEITIANPALIGKLNPGEKYYVDFTPAE